MEKLQNALKEKQTFWMDFKSKRECKSTLNELKKLGFKWFNGKEINTNEGLDFYFTLEINPLNLTVGFVPCFMRFNKTPPLTPVKD